MSDPVHPQKAGTRSRKEFQVGARTLSDYQTAHSRAGDTSYQTPLPETCWECFSEDIEEARVAVKKVIASGEATQARFVDGT